MKRILTKLLSVVAILAAMNMSVIVYAETVETRIGKLSFTHDFANGYPTKETVQKLYDERDFQRACQAYLWALPIVGIAQWQQQVQTVLGAGNLDFAYLQGYDGLTGMMTPNVTTPYIVAVSDLTVTGPLVVEIPAGASAGGVDDAWQRPIMDMGLAGPDQGKGAKYLLLGPGQRVSQTEGFIVVDLPSMTALFGLRNLEADPEKAEQLQKRFRFYPYSQRDNPPTNRYVRVGNHKEFNTTPPSGLAYWERLAEILYREPVQERDRIMMAMLRPLGIEKGKPFQPDERQKKILTEAAFVGEAMAKANDFERRNLELSHYNDGVQWQVTLCLDVGQEAEFYTQLDERAAYFYEGGPTTKAMVTKIPGLGQAYLSAYKDKNGDWLDGAKTYRLHIPPNPPVKQFWSVTIYDVGTRFLINNPQKIADRSSRQPDLLKNPDGSVDIYVAPTPPKGFEKNWIPSVPGKAWFAWFRLYAPTEAHFNQTWILPDFEKVN